MPDVPRDEHGESGDVDSQPPNGTAIWYGRITRGRTSMGGMCITAAGMVHDPEPRRASVCHTAERDARPGRRARQDRCFFSVQPQQQQQQERASPFAATFSEEEAIWSLIRGSDWFPCGGDGEKRSHPRFALGRARGWNHPLRSHWGCMPVT